MCSIILKPFALQLKRLTIGLARSLLWDSKQFTEATNSLVCRGVYWGAYPVLLRLKGSLWQSGAYWVSKEFTLAQKGSLEIRRTHWGSERFTVKVLELQQRITVS